jgi:hypothetical protein
MIPVFFPPTQRLPRLREDASVASETLARSALRSGFRKARLP